ncbi:SDR family oxidoreductase [Gynurincola endophyticus]|uniref:SDR family oxidoreductase n=1 Tax=Gynurincola endophyticus TaxID=2479004 RepID=UPI000F8C631B|nr:SDR family oxidoreductase [Gynurincola endophyticus]
MTQKKILITGANGFLGQFLVRDLWQKGYEVIATGKGENRLPFTYTERFTYDTLDIGKSASVHSVFDKHKPNLVIHAAAITQVDDAERNTELAEQINVQGTAEVLVDAETYAEYILFISTDFVFDGNKGMYEEEDDLQPLSFYGFTKMQAEAIMSTAEIPYSIVRTCLVYGKPLSGARSNIIQWVSGKLQANEAIKVVNDQVRTPTYVEDLSKAIVQLVEQRLTGIYHISGKEVFTPYEMAVATANYLGADTSLITPVDASTFKEVGKRPLKTGFSIKKAETLIGFQPVSFQEALIKIFEQ